MTRHDDKAGGLVKIERTTDEVRAAWEPYFRVQDAMRDVTGPEAPLLYSFERRRGRRKFVCLSLVGPDSVQGEFDEGDGQGEVIGGLGHLFARATEDARFLLSELDAASARHAEFNAIWNSNQEQISQAGLDLAAAAAEAGRLRAENERLARELADARDDATRFRHELRLAEGCLSKPGADVGGVIAGLRLAQKRETGTWAIPAEKLRGEE